MSLKVNNRDVSFIADETVQDLLKRMKFTFPLIIVKINGDLVPRSKFSEVIVPDNADIKVIHMISGG